MNRRTLLKRIGMALALPALASKLELPSHCAAIAPRIRLPREEIGVTHRVRRWGLGLPIDREMMLNGGTE